MSRVRLAPPITNGAAHGIAVFLAGTDVRLSIPAAQALRDDLERAIQSALVLSGPCHVPPPAMGLSGKLDICRTDRLRVIVATRGLDFVASASSVPFKPILLALEGAGTDTGSLRKLAKWIDETVEG